MGVGPDAERVDHVLGFSSDGEKAIRQTPPGRGSKVASTPIHCTIFIGSVK